MVIKANLFVLVLALRQDNTLDSNSFAIFLLVQGQAFEEVGGTLVGQPIQSIFIDKTCTLKFLLAFLELCKGDQQLFIQILIAVELDSMLENLNNEFATCVSWTNSKDLRLWHLQRSRASPQISHS